MKNIKLLIAFTISAVIIITACDNRKFLKDQTPVPPPVVVDSIAFDLTKDVDTINTQVLTFGGYTWRFRCFDRFKQPLPNVALGTSFQYRLNTGSQTYNNRTLGDTTLRSDTYYSLKYIPVLTNGKHEFLISLSNGYGKTFRDTVSFFVKTYTAVAFSYTLSPKSFGSIRPSGTQTTMLTLTSSDIRNTVKYYLDYEAPVNVVNNQISLAKGATTFVSGSELARGANNFTIQLTGHPTGLNFKMPIKIRDENGDFFLDTIVYNCKANTAPSVSNASSLFTRTLASATFGPTTSVTGTRYSCSYTTYNYRDNLFNTSCTLNVTATDDGEFGSGPTKIVAAKITLPNSQQIQIAPTTPSANVQFVFSNGQITFRYPNNSGLIPIQSTGCRWPASNYSNKYQSPTAPNPWIINNGSSTVAVNNLTLSAGNVVRISVQDSEGAWSADYLYTIPNLNNTNVASTIWQ